MSFGDRLAIVAIFVALFVAFVTIGVMYEIERQVLKSRIYFGISITVLVVAIIFFLTSAGVNTKTADASSLATSTATYVTPSPIPRPTPTPDDSYQRSRDLFYRGRNLALDPSADLAYAISLLDESDGIYQSRDVEDFRNICEDYYEGKDALLTGDIKHNAKEKLGAVYYGTTPYGAFRDVSVQYAQILINEALVRFKAGYISDANNMFLKILEIKIGNAEQQKFIADQLQQIQDVLVQTPTAQ